MNGLYGYRMAGASTIGAYPSMAGLGQSASEKKQAEVTIISVIDGSAHKDLKKFQRAQIEQNAQIGAIKVELDKVPDSPQKAQAMTLWQSARAENRQLDSNLRKAIDKYNELARIIRQVTLDLAQPPLMSGLGLAPALAAALPAIIKAAAWLAISLAALMAASRFNFEKTEGLLNSLGKALENLAGALQEGAEKAPQILTGTAWVAAVLVGGYVAWNLFGGLRL